MLDLFALIVSIYLLIQLTRLRAVLSFVFPRVHAQRLDAATPPEGCEDLHAAADAELRRLGFDGPYWYAFDSADETEVPASTVAAYHHAESQDTLWLHAPLAPNRPHDLLIYFIRMLRDGRIATSQALDPYSELLADARTPAQTLGAGTLQEHWTAHARWCDSLGDTDTSMPLEARLAFQAADFHNQRRQSLLDRGLAYLDRRGLARPGLRFGLRMLKSVRRTAGAVANIIAVPPARMELIARSARRFTSTDAPLRVQAGLFALSVMLFLAVGGIVWGARFALILLVVVAIHELGHYVAMRAFGYRHVQMLTLPLVGGVTMGHEQVPDAARRAWTSLMGPLPGIVIGWCLLLLTYTMSGRH